MLFLDPSRDDPADLIDAFIATLRANPEDDPRRLHNAGRYVGLAVGGKPRDFIAVPDDHEIVPDSLLARYRDDGYTVSDDEWCALLRERLLELARRVEPAFLVRSLVHYVADWYRSFCANESADENRAFMREEFYAIADDPVRLAEWRERIRDTESYDPSWSDDEIAHQLRRMGDRIEPTDADEALRNWAAHAAWERDTAALLSTD